MQWRASSPMTTPSQHDDKLTAAEQLSPGYADHGSRVLPWMVGLQQGYEQHYCSPRRCTVLYCTVLYRTSTSAMCAARLRTDTSRMRCATAPRPAPEWNCRGRTSGVPRMRHLTC